MLTKYQPKNFIARKQPDPNEIIMGKVITKAALHLDGKVHIIAVFNTSTEFMFFFHFEAPTSRTPRRKWTFTKQYHMLQGDATTIRGRTIHYTMKSIATQWALRLKSTKTTIRNYLPAKTVRQMFHQVGNPVAQGPRPGDTFFKANERTTGKRLDKYDKARLTAMVKTQFNSQTGDDK